MKEIKIAISIMLITAATGCASIKIRAPKGGVIHFVPQVLSHVNIGNSPKSHASRRR